ncbi:L-dopachrome tautomerase-related protein [Entomomonas asaccharolytica]|uniref:Gluconolaconase n=1 Tax=Entomomonas asaccharolytica TaxID=2785331 RepID=A0A974RXR6_9GAMM|nr:L-dopachrome tautomerase-related protein [Entomomonas asaccharolytica]QQP86523.1 gluconolaconase [Entomomonas asaccharolytica]
MLLSIKSNAKKLIIATSIVILSTLPVYAAKPPIDLSSLPTEKFYGNLEAVAAFNGAMPTGVTVAEDGRIFVNFPRWGDDVPFTVAELVDGEAVAYPSKEINKANKVDIKNHFISVQSVVADGRGRLWVLDTAAPKFSSPVVGGAKLVAIDLNTNKIVKTLLFPAEVLTPQTYLNDMRFDFRVGEEGVAYVTESSASGGIIVMDLKTGKALRRLTGDVAAAADKSFIAIIEGEALLRRSADGKTSAFAAGSDGIALSNDGKILYFSPLSSRHLYAIATDLLRDPNVTDAELSKAVKDLGEKGASDGLESDANGAVYAGNYEHNSIRKRLPNGEWQTIVHDPRILWPDTLAIGPDGYLYFTANQLHRQAGFHKGKDKREKPYSLFRIKINEKPNW